MLTGIVFALLALLSWAIGDFLIQRTVRAVGDLRTLLWIDGIGAIILLPFVVRDLPTSFHSSAGLALATAAGVVIFFTALMEFEALRRGKISVIEPIMSIELLVTVALAVALWGERLSPLQLLLVGATFIGILLAVTVHHTHLRFHKRIFERGVALAAGGAITMGVVNFLVGASSQNVSPLFVIWWSNVVTLVLAAGYLAIRDGFGALAADIRSHGKLILGVSVVDNAAWVFFASAAALIPIGIASAVSESYVALAVLLGLFLNREQIRWHQGVGIAVTVGSVILLSALTGGN
ncbi:MAG: DMT family transporter [bacterium]|nr:DMT family transporter [bacterium]